MTVIVFVLSCVVLVIACASMFMAWRNLKATKAFAREAASYADQACAVNAEAEARDRNHKAGCPYPGGFCACPVPEWKP